MPVANQEIRWILRAQTGDKGALNELLKVIQEPLYRYIHNLVGQAHLAENIVQEVFLLIYRKVRWLREPELFRAWVYRIATREAVKHLRREKQWSEQIRDEEFLNMLPDSSSSPAYLNSSFADADSIFERIDNLSDYIARLSPASRVVIALHYQNELTLEEVAQVLGLSVGTVKSRLAYGLRTLRQNVLQKSE